MHPVLDRSAVEASIFCRLEEYATAACMWFHFRWSKTGSSLRWCWTACFCGCSPPRVWSEPSASSSRRRRSTTCEIRSRRTTERSRSEYHVADARLDLNVALCRWRRRRRRWWYASIVLQLQTITEWRGCMPSVAWLHWSIWSNCSPGLSISFCAIRANQSLFFGEGRGWRLNLG